MNNLARKFKCVQLSTAGPLCLILDKKCVDKNNACRSILGQFHGHELWHSQRDVRAASVLVQRDSVVGLHVKITFDVKGGLHVWSHDELDSDHQSASVLGRIVGDWKFALDYPRLKQGSNRYWHFSYILWVGMVLVLDMELDVCSLVTNFNPGSTFYFKITANISIGFIVHLPKCFIPHRIEVIQNDGCFSDFGFS